MRGGKVLRKVPSRYWRRFCGKIHHRNVLEVSLKQKREGFQHPMVEAGKVFAPLAPLRRGTFLAPRVSKSRERFQHPKVRFLPREVRFVPRIP